MLYLAYIIAYREFTRNYNPYEYIMFPVGIIAYREFTRNYNEVRWKIE